MERYKSFLTGKVTYRLTEEEYNKIIWENRKAKFLLSHPNYKIIEESDRKIVFSNRRQ